MSRFGDLIRGKSEPDPVPIVEEVLITPQEEVLTEASPLEKMTKDELEDLGRTMGVELDKRHSKAKLIEELESLG